MFSSTLLIRKGRVGDLYTAEGDVTLPLMTASGTGTYIPVPYTAEGDVTLPLMTASGTGARVPLPHVGTGSVTLPSMNASGTGRLIFKYGVRILAVQDAPHYYRQDLLSIHEGSRWNSQAVNVSIRRASDDALMENLGNTVDNGPTWTTFTWFNGGTYTFTSPSGLMTFQGPHYSRAAYTEGVLYDTVFTINGFGYRTSWQLN